MSKPLTTREFFKQFPDDEACLAHLFNVRFGKEHSCPKCGTVGRWYRIQAERAYSCGKCGHHLHPTVGTPFEQTRTPLQLWFYAIHLFTATRHGVSAKELQRQLGVTYKTAWRMAGLIRDHMATVDGEAPIGGPGTAVEIDETMVGGVRKGKRGRGAAGKTVVLGMMQRDGEIVAKVVPNVRRATLQPLVEAHVAPGGELHTDEFLSYAGLHAKGYVHRTVNHNAGEHVASCGAHIQGIEGFWRHLKCSLAGTHVSVSAKHLGRYVKEFEYRFNRRGRAASMLGELLSTFPLAGAR
jgi:transposase